VEYGLDPKIAAAICEAADQVIDGSLYDDHFPLGKSKLRYKSFLLS
jgi:hypothetical protein